MHTIVKHWSYLLAVAASSLAGCINTGRQQDATTATDEKWWKEAVVYQLYPRSFKDSDGDGIGDLKGIIEKLDYLKSLGIDVVWLNPIYASPNYDNGYDVSDYRAIMEDFGTMADFDLLLKGMHERGIKLVMDIVVNHSSDEHVWFKQSRSSRNNPYRNYYHWWPAEKGKPPYRYSLFDESRNAWQYDTPTNAYYLHYFSKKQPDLNWENPALRQEIYDMMNFWAAKGVDGFRLDAFQFAAKDTSWPELPTGYEKEFAKYVAMKPQIHDYLKEMHQKVFSRYDLMTVSEGAGNSFEDAHNLVDADRKELDMAYAFDAIDLATSRGYDFLQFKQVFSKWDSAFAQKGWLSIFLANHDNARMVSRWVNAAPEQRQTAAKMLNTFLLTMRGTPYCYYGDELGMDNPGFTQIQDFNDVSTQSDYRYALSKGANADSMLREIQFYSRVNGRTPMQWSAEANAGFSKGKPWLMVNKNYTQVNVAAQDKDPASCLNHFRKAVQLRKDHKALVYGKYTLVDAANKQVYAYTREYNKQQYLVVLNFSPQTATVTTGISLAKAKTLLNNYDGSWAGETLQPFQAVVLQLN